MTTRDPGITHSKSAILVFAVLLTASLSVTHANEGKDPAAPASTLKQQFSDHTIHYIDKASGKQHSIYFGRFGDFEKYFPCQYVDGTWQIDEDGLLCLKYSVGDQRKQCRKPEFSDSQVTLSSPNDEVPLAAKIVAGNKLPFG